MTYRPMTAKLYNRLCQVIYRLDEKGRQQHMRRRRTNLRISKAMFDDHGTFHEEKV